MKIGCLLNFNDNYRKKRMFLKLIYRSITAKIQEKYSLCISIEHNTLFKTSQQTDIFQLPRTYSSI